MITLHTGVGIEGIPIQWTDKQVIITYPDNNNYTIIFNPLKNIMMVSVFADTSANVKQRSVEQDKQSNIRNITEVPKPVLSNFESNPQLRAVKLANLHVQKNKAIKKTLNKYLKNTMIRTSQVSPYDTPDFTK